MGERGGEAAGQATATGQTDKEGRRRWLLRWRLDGAKEWGLLKWESATEQLAHCGQPLSLSVSFCLCLSPALYLPSAPACPPTRGRAQMEREWRTWDGIGWDSIG